MKQEMKMAKFLSLAKITVKVDTKTEITDPVKEMLLNKIKDIPDEYVIKFSDVKQTYPDIADKLKEKLFQNKGTLTVKDIKILVKDMKVTDDKFWLSEVPYTLTVQKKLSKDQVVIQFNFTPDMVSEIKKSKSTFKFLSNLFAKKEGSVHPLNNQTFSWARLYKFPKEAWVIEEMQSDFIGWDSNFKSMTKEQQQEFDTFKEEEQKEILDFFKKNFDRWEHKFIATLTQMARKEGVKDIYIFDESEKGGQATSPSKLKWFYRTVPKHMGMVKKELDIGSSKYQVWHKATANINKPNIISALQQVIRKG